MLVQEVNDANVAIDLSWDKDGLDVEHDPVKSMAVFLQWWTSGNNYIKYRGTDNKGRGVLNPNLKISNCFNHYFY